VTASAKIKNIKYIRAKAKQVVYDELAGDRFGQSKAPSPLHKT
tara:strand:- start:288 stop:416 length:129 start_codon:yes stop_codon:yes gene_type:complete